MPEPNGTGRMERIEAALERVSDDIVLLHSIAKLQSERLTTAQTSIEKDRLTYLEERKLIDARLDAMSAQTDKRIADLVRAIGQLIAKPPETGAKTG